MRQIIPADAIKYTEMGKEEVDVLGMKLELNLMVGGMYRNDFNENFRFKLISNLQH